MFPISHPMYKCSYHSALRFSSFFPPPPLLKKREHKCLLYAMVSLPGNLRSLKVCMLMTSSVLTMTGGWGLCLSRRWHLRDTRSSSIMALQKDLCEGKERKRERMKERGSWSDFYLLSNSEIQLHVWSNGHTKELYIWKKGAFKILGKKKKKWDRGKLWSMLLFIWIHTESIITKAISA